MERYGKNVRTPWDEGKEPAKNNPHSFHDLNPKPTFNFRSTLNGFAFNVGLMVEEMDDKIRKDPETFEQIYKIAVEEKISYSLAEFKYGRQENLLSNVREYQNTGAKEYPVKGLPLRVKREEPGPQRIYNNPHKVRSTRGKRSALAAFARWIMQDFARNSEESTPLDDTPPWEIFGNE